MIVDTSALIALVKEEQGLAALVAALVTEEGLLPAPALVEFERVVSRSRDIRKDKAKRLLHDLFDGKLSVLQFTRGHADTAVAANADYGIGVAHRGTLNLLDLMVYACAKVEGRPILCTGRDFAATDALIHPASRIAG